MSEQQFYPDKETQKRCLERLRKSNYKLELYNLFLDEAIAIMEQAIAINSFEENSRSN